MNYHVEIKKRAKKFIDSLPLPDRRRIFAALVALPYAGDIKRLQAQGEELYRLRVGNYRIIYTVDHDKLVILVIDAGNRGQIYNRY